LPRRIVTAHLAIIQNHLPAIEHVCFGSLADSRHNTILCLLRSRKRTTQRRRGSRYTGSRACSDTPVAIVGRRQIGVTSTTTSETVRGDKESPVVEGTQQRPGQS
jgi:hypothetical protein